MPIFQCHKIGKKKTWMSIHLCLGSMLHLCSCIFSLLRHLPKYLPIINEKRTMMNEFQLLIEMWIMMDELHPTNFSLSLSLSLFILFFSFPLINSCYLQCILTFAWHWVDPFVDQKTLVVEIHWSIVGGWVCPMWGRWA
jgi:hypothetical protein